MSRSAIIVAGWMLLNLQVGTIRAADEYRTQVLPFLKAHCVKCHGSEKQDGDLSLTALKGDLATEKAIWTQVLERITSGEMPPKKEPRPPELSTKAVTEWLAAGLKLGGGSSPKHGNLVPHELLFGKPAGAVDPPAGRVWLLRPEAYFGLVRDVYRGRQEGLTQPFASSGERGFKDYSATSSVDEAATEILIRNAELIVTRQTAYVLEDGKPKWANDTIGEFKPLFANEAPTKAQVETAFRTQFRLATARDPLDEELARLAALYEKNLKVADRPSAVRTTLTAILLRADSIFRVEHGSAAGKGQRLLAPKEIAQAISLALGDQRESSLYLAATKGQLGTPDEVKSQVRRMLDDPKARNTRLMKFFREYFEYELATDVFKDRAKDLMHEPRVLVADTDRLVQDILNRDTNVLRELLTTTKTYANYAYDEKKKLAKPAQTKNAHNNKGQSPPEAAYGFESWPEVQPAETSPGQRAGILTQPSWLVAHSTNFDNDPVRRGKWIRERLLGGFIPDVPIGVAAQVPDDPHRTIRDRVGSVTRAVSCWKCHQRMDDLGLPFEQYDHYGRFRLSELVLDREATAKNVDKKGRLMGNVLHEAKLDTTGLISQSGEAKLDGPVQNPVEFAKKLAESERVRQVFVRHAFRFFLGRNEMPGDAKTLQYADQAYVKSGGSFKTLVASLLTSDSFLYRKP